MTTPYPYEIIAEPTDEAIAQAEHRRLRAVNARAFEQMMRLAYFMCLWGRESPLYETKLSSTRDSQMPS